MTTTSAANPGQPAPGQPSADSDGSASTAGGGIQRVNAFDGLFLRAEHLNLIQDYALELATAVGAGGGPGVVDGFDVTLSGDSLLVGRGLAIDGAGRPLRSGHLVSLSLKDRSVPADGFWWIEIVSSLWGYRDEAVTGALCDEPCSGGSTSKLFTVEGVEIRLAEGTVVGLGDQPWSTRRSWLASRLFAQEESEAHRWPAGPNDPARLLDRSWAPPAEVPGRPTAVRIGVVVPPPPAGGDRQVDAWAVRRDRGAPPPVRDWQWRLGMRPWDVFVAQVLQFQALLAERLALHGYHGPSSWMEMVLEGLDAAHGEVMKLTKLKLQQQLEKLRTDVAEGFPSAGKPVRVPEVITLPGLGIEELPPAGYLPYTLGPVSGVAAEISRLLGGLAVRVCTGAPADIAQAVQEAQHRDRIRLMPGDEVAPPVDVLVPVGADPLVPLYDWVAFVRRDGRRCEGMAEEFVDVYLVDDSANKASFDRDVKILSAGRLPGPERCRSLGHVTYPADEWALPGGDEYAAVFEAISEMAGRPAVAAFVTADERRPLGAVRALLLATRFGGSTVPPAELITAKAPGAEAIILVIGPDDR